MAPSVADDFLWTPHQQPVAQRTIDRACSSKQVQEDRSNPPNEIQWNDKLSDWCSGLLKRFEQQVGTQRQTTLLDMISSLQCVPRVRCEVPRSRLAGTCPTSTMPRIRCTVPGVSARRNFPIRGNFASTSKRISHETDDFRSAILSDLQHFFENSLDGAAARARLCAMLADAVAPLATGTSVSSATAVPGGPTMAFCPFSLGCMSDLSVKELRCVPTPLELPELGLRELEQMLMVTTLLQGSLGLARIFLGEAFSGSYAVLLAIVGFNARHPGPAANWLKTYVLITFINGTMGSIDICQNALLHNFPAVLASLPLKMNLAHLVQLTVPGVSFLGAFAGWQHFKMQRKVAMESYQQQLAMMMEQVAWPPPGMSFGLPGYPNSGQAGYEYPEPPPGFPPLIPPGMYPPHELFREGQFSVEDGSAPADACDGHCHGQGHRLSVVDEEPEESLSENEGNREASVAG